VTTAGEALRRAYAAALETRGLEREPAQVAALEALADLADRLQQAHSLQGRLRRWLRWRPVGQPPPTQRGLYLWGPVGRGKTFLLDLFRAALTVPARRQHFHHFMRDVHLRLQKLRRRPNPLTAVADEIAREAHVICFDELHVTDIADAMILYGLLDALLRRGVTFVFTSNQPPAGLYAGGLQRERFLPAIGLLERELDVIEVAGSTDFRLRSLQQVPVYFPVADPATPARMTALFDRLAGMGDARGEPGRLLIEGRRIPTLRQRPGVAWFSFATLCEGARGQADYIELARLHHTLFVSGVPVLDAGQDDAARRFIGLIDELYDRNVKLVLSAAADPAALYTGTRLAAPFGRTASRLIEMRSAEYLARPRRIEA
jgi:cell division protein ZapE